MALSKQDQAFYEEKLGWKSFGFLMGTTIFVGSVMWPLLIYLMDWSAGQTSQWSFNLVLNLAVMGFLLGSVVSVIMYLIFKFFLSIGWLPKRR